MDIAARRRLDANGFGLQTIGFDGAELPLYAHKATAIAARGEIQMRLRIANPPNLNAGEIATLERKAAAGFFQWMPGNECMQRSFKDVRVTRDPETDERRVETSGTYRGCKWCRGELSSNGSQGGGAEAGFPADGSENESSFSPPENFGSPVPLEADGAQVTGDGSVDDPTLPARLLLSSRATPRDLTVPTPKPLDPTTDREIPQQPADAASDPSATVGKTKESNPPSHEEKAEGLSFRTRSGTSQTDSHRQVKREMPNQVQHDSSLVNFVCTHCDFAPKPHSRSGKLRSPGQLKQSLDMHTRAKHGV